MFPLWLPCVTQPSAEVACYTTGPPASALEIHRPPEIFKTLGEPDADLPEISTRAAEKYASMPADRSTATAATAAAAAAALAALAWRRRRARSADTKAMAILAARNARMHSTKAIRHGRAFDVRASDVFVVTYPKCGTTWVSAIAHFLRGGDEDDFGEICEVMPWDIIALDCGQNCNDEQGRSPRLFKSHEAVWKSKFYGAFVLNRRVVLHAIDATPARWREHPIILH